MVNPSRRALLASFLAAPVAVRMGRWVKPAPQVFTVVLGSSRTFTNLGDKPVTFTVVWNGEPLTWRGASYA